MNNANQLAKKYDLRIDADVDMFAEDIITQYKASLVPVAWRTQDHAVKNRYFVFADLDNAYACSIRIGKPLEPLYALKETDK